MTQVSCVSAWWNRNLQPRGPFTDQFKTPGLNKEIGFHFWAAACKPRIKTMPSVGQSAVKHANSGLWNNENTVLWRVESYFCLAVRWASLVWQILGKSYLANCNVKSGGRGITIQGCFLVLCSYLQGKVISMLQHDILHNAILPTLSALWRRLFSTPL